MKAWEFDKKRKGSCPSFQFWYRMAQNTPPRFLTLFYKIMLRLTRFCYKVEITEKVKIGPGLYIGHPYCITINDKATIGSNCNLHKGVTIGQENRGPRKGYPKIGNCVWIGINSTIVGNITIGDDVLIAPNSFINCDIPSHSVVYGNPCIIKHKDNATESYINNKI